MATVYLARDLRHDRLVALKVLYPELAATLGPHRFLREIRLTARLDHPNILPVLDSGETAGLLWYTMPYVEGESLRERLRREVQLSVEDAVRLAGEAAEALDCAHEQGVVHRDIKPENILLSRGHARVADFGVAFALEAAGTELPLTETGLAVGTPPYMSPEQASGGKSDPRTDVYALGCVLYEMLAGEPPFTGPTPQAITAKRLSGEVPQVRRLRPAVPEYVGRAVAKALAPLAADRFQTAAELARALAPGHTSEPGSTTAAAVARRRRWKVSPVAATALVLLVIGVLGLLWWVSSAPRGPGVAALQDPLGTDSASNPQLPLTSQPSVAVLPFVNLSPDPANDYFSDGVTEELITALSRVEGLRVAARASSFAFKGKPLDVPEVARKLNVSSVLDGSVRRAGQRLRVTAELVDARDGTRLWADRFDRELRDVFQVQDELARAIVGALRVPLKLTSRSDTALVRVGTVDPAAHDLYLQGRYLWNQRTHDALRRAIGYFERAIQRDSTYAEAYAGLSDTYVLLPQTFQVRPRDMYPRARRAAERALALDSTLAEAHTSLALLRMFEYDWEGAEAGFRRAIALNPNYATAHQWYSTFLNTVGRTEESLVELERARALDPLSRVITRNLGGRLAQLGRYDEAVRQIRSALALEPKAAATHNTLCLVYLLQRLAQEAVRACEQGAALSAPREVRMGLLARAHAAAGDTAKAAALVRELATRSRREYVSPFEMAAGYLALGDADRVFTWLDSAYAVQDPFLAQTLSGKMWDPVRADPRFARLRERMGLPP